MRYNVPVEYWRLLIFVLFLVSVVSRKSICPEMTTCDCHPDAGMVDVNCKNVTTLTPIQKLLNTTLSGQKINFLVLENCSITVLPDDVFLNFSILIFKSFCPFIDIQDEGLRSIDALSIVELQGPRFSVLPNGLRNLKSIKTLDILQDNLPKITDDLANLTSLKYVTISHCALEHLSEDSFAHNTEVTYLDLSTNKLTFVHPNTFDSLIKLQKLNMRGNLLTTIDGLLKNLNPQVLSFHYNQLTSIRGAFHAGMDMLKTLYLGRNKIQYLNASTLAGKTNNLEYLDLTGNKFSHVDPVLLKSFVHLRKIHFSGLGLQELPQGFFQNLMNLEIINLNHNHLKSIYGAFKNNPQLHRLSLSYNDLNDVVHGFETLPRLSWLSLTRNNIRSVYEGDLSGLPHLQYFMASENKMERLDKKAFAGLHNLTVILLNSNHLLTLNYSIQHLVSLEELQCKSNNLEIIYEDELTELPKLVKVDLVNNLIRSANGAFRRLNSMTYLNLAQNRLTTLSRDSLPEQIKLKKLYLGSGNKWNCDCRLLWLVEWLSSTNGSALKDHAFCHQPPRLYNTTLLKLTPKDVIDWPDNCPHPCKCTCQPKGRDFYVKVDCSNLQLSTIPDPLPNYLGELDMQGNSLSDIVIKDPSVVDKLETLNLSDNSIDNMKDMKLPVSLKVLALDGNKLKKFAASSIDGLMLQSLTLSRNPWICDCSTIPFRKWLLSAGPMVTDVNETKCGDISENNRFKGKLITSLKDTDLCPSKLSLYVDIGIGVLSMLLVITSAIVVYTKFHIRLKIWMYAGGITWVKKEEDVDKDKLFDAFISHSASEQQFVLEELAPGLELGEPSFQVFIHSRNSAGGTYRIDGKLAAVEKSKRVIVVLSQNYIEDGESMHIFKTAVDTCLKDKVIYRIIIVQYGKLTLTDDMDPTLKNMLNATKALVWGEKRFWEKLWWALPKKTTKLRRKLREYSTTPMPLQCTDDPDVPLLAEV